MNRPAHRRLAAAAALLTLLALLPLDAAQAQGALPAIAIKTAADGAQTYSLTFQVLILMTVLTLLPAMLLAMTAFTRIIIVLSILRQALGMPTTPSNQILTGLALFMTFFVMSATVEQVLDRAARSNLIIGDRNGRRWGQQCHRQRRQRRHGDGDGGGGDELGHAN